MFAKGLDPFLFVNVWYILVKFKNLVHNILIVDAKEKEKEKVKITNRKSQNIIIHFLFILSSELQG